LKEEETKFKNKNDCGLLHQLII